MAFDKSKEAGAIWKMTSRKGTEYLSITLTIDGQKRQFAAFKNRKAKDTHPDYRIFVSEPQKAGAPEPKKKSKPQAKPEPPDDPFPF